MPRVYIYVIARDFGFAPNPFHGYCTLATCKPIIRRTAAIGDWIFGLGGARLKATGRCIFAMKVTQKLSFNQYWLDPEFRDKRPVRNGTKKMMVGDNIYCYDQETSCWLQEPSHHSNLDGSVNRNNLTHDTGTDVVLTSDWFIYFGKSAPIIPIEILSELQYKNSRNHRVFSYKRANKLVEWLESEYSDKINKVLGPPFDFERSGAHYSIKTDKITGGLSTKI